MRKQLLTNLKRHKHIAVIMLAFFQLDLFIVWFFTGVLEVEAIGLTLAGILALVGVVLYVIFGVLNYHQDFMLALSMGRTRREFMILDAAEKLTWVILSYLCAFLVCLFEESICYRIPDGFFLVRILIDWRVFLPCIALLVILPMFFGALYSRLRKWFGLVLHCFWLFSFLVLPRLANQLETQIDLGWLEKFSTLGWTVLAIAALAAMTATTVILGMKQMVR